MKVFKSILYNKYKVKRFTSSDSAIVCRTIKLKKQCNSDEKVIMLFGTLPVVVKKSNFELFTDFIFNKIKNNIL